MRSSCRLSRCPTQKPLLPRYAIGSFFEQSNLGFDPPTNFSPHVQYQSGSDQLLCGTWTGSRDNFDSTPVRDGRVRR